MRWIPYFILAYVSLGLQIGLGELPFMRAGGPKLPLLAVIFIAVNASREAALLGSFGIGIMQDITTLSPLGLYALAYALVAMFVVSTQELVYREHPLTHFSLALLGGLLTAAVVLLQGWIRPIEPAMPGIAPAARVSVASLFSMAIYTAALAPIVLGLLQKIRRSFAFTPPRRRAW